MTIYEILQTFYKGKGIGLSEQDKIVGMQYVRRYAACNYPDIANELNKFNTPMKASADVFAILLMSGTKMHEYLKFTGDTVNWGERKDLINVFETGYRDIEFLKVIAPEKYNECVGSFEEAQIKNKKK